MPSFYVNLIAWAVALAGLIAWARFAVFVGRDVRERLRNQSELLWKIVVLVAPVVMVLVWVVGTFWILAWFINVALAAGVVGWYWVVRVQELGDKGHLFRGTIESVGKAKHSIREHKAQSQVALTYLTAGDKPLALAEASEAMAAGLSLADEMVVQGMARRTENVELLPGQAGYDLRFYVDGVLYPQAPLARPAGESIIQAVKMLGGLTVEERRRPQEGAFKVRDEEGNITKWTVRTSGSTAGEKLFLAANEEGRWTLNLDQLGMSTEQLNIVRELTADTQGVVLVASPRGSGRTATLYALLRQHDAFTNAVHTLEANPQTEIEGVTVHRFDGRGPETTYAKALQSLFLKDPTIVLSAQCPDAASAEATARFAAEFHRVYVGMPAFDTMAGLEMWLGLVPDKEMAVQALRAIISQRLVRLLCPTCKIPYQPDEATLRKLNLPVGRNLQSFKANTEGLRDQKGHVVPCPDCNSTGFRGRTGIFEILVLTDEMRKEIQGGATLKQVQATARKNNMTLLVEQGIRKFGTGLTAINEVLRVLQPDRGGAGPSSASGVMRAQK